MLVCVSKIGISRGGRGIGPSWPATCFDDLHDLVSPATAEVHLQYQHGIVSKNIVLHIRETHDQGFEYVPLPKPTLYNLPVEVLVPIYKNVLCAQGPVIFNLDTGKRTGIEAALLSMRTPNPLREHHYWPEEMFWGGNNFVFRMSSNTGLMASSRFQSLEHILCQEHGSSGYWRYPWARRARAFPCGRMYLELSFKEGLSLADVRFGVKDLLRLTSAYDNQRFDIRVSLMHGHEGNPRSHTTSLYNLQARVLGLLYLRYLPGAAQLRATDFDIFVDGYGEARSVQIISDDKRHTLTDEFVGARKHTEEYIRSTCGRAYDGYGSGGRYDGSLSCWVHYLQHIMTPPLLKPVLYPEECSKMHFGYSKVFTFDTIFAPLAPENMP